VDYKEFFKGKKATQIGLGLLGRGVGDADFLARNLDRLTVTDLKKKEDLEPSLKKLAGYTNIDYVFGEHRLSDFADKDFILKAAGVPLDSPYINEARKNKIPIEMDASLFFKLAMAKGTPGKPFIKFIGVTGTRGKSTTTVMIYEVLKRAGKRVFLAGNIKDIATLPLIEKIEEGDYVVAELDSWQLQGFAEIGMSPQYAVFTNFMPDHMNYYKGSMEAYFEDKSAIFRNQKKGDTLIVGEGAEHLVKGKTQADIVVAKEKNLKGGALPYMHGEHNLLNAACAVTLCDIFGINRQLIWHVFSTFRGLTGRMEFLREYDGVVYFNDTNATTPDATIAGLKALCPHALEDELRIVLIAGGTDKGLDPAPLSEAVARYCKGLVLLPGTGTDKLLPMLERINYDYSKIDKVSNLEEALAQARKRASKGDIVLFSPAFTSFGLFKNEYDRGERYITLVSHIGLEDFLRQNSSKR